MLTANDFAPQILPEPPTVLKLYRNMDKQEKENFLKDNPDYFRTGNEGCDYLDTYDRIMCENTRNLVYLIESRDEGKNIEAAKNMIKNYHGKEFFINLAPEKHRDELRIIKNL